MLSLSYALSIPVILFVIGCVGILIRRNFLFILLSLEIMINAAALAFVIVGAYMQQVDGQIMYILIITFAASESAIYLAFLLRLYHSYHTFYIDKINELRG